MLRVASTFSKNGLIFLDKNDGCSAAWVLKLTHSVSRKDFNGSLRLQTLSKPARPEWMIHKAKSSVDASENKVHPCAPCTIRSERGVMLTGLVRGHPATPNPPVIAQGHPGDAQNASIPSVFFLPKFCLHFLFGRKTPKYLHPSAV